MLTINCETNKEFSMFSRFGFMPFFAILMLGMFLSMNAAWAQLPSEVEETSFNLQLNSLPGSKTSIGTGLEIPIKFGAVNGFIASLFQSNGAVVRGRYHAELGFNFKNFRIIPYLNGTGRGPGWKEVALVNDVGLSFEVQGVGGKYFDVRGGFFGQSGGAFGKSNLFDLGAANGYDENRMEEFSDANGITLAQLNQAPDGIDTDVLAILDSDAYILAQNKPLEFYKKLTSPLFKRRPTTTWFYIKSDIPYFSWVRGCLLATGRPTSDITPKTSLNELEHSCFERMGFADHEIEVVLGHNDNVKRLFCDDYLSTFPKNHPVRDFIVDNIHLNHCPPHLYAIWAYHNELFVQNYDILGVPIYISETSFIEASTYNCMAHIRTMPEKDGQKSRVDEYYDVFLKHLTLNMPNDALEVSNPQTVSVEKTHENPIIAAPELAEKTGAITFHCVSIPHMKIKNGSVNPHTQNVVDTCKALKNAGFKVCHYGHSDSELDCTEHIPVLSEDVFDALYGDVLVSNDYSYIDTVYTEFCMNTIKEIRDRANPGDFVICFWGIGHKQIVQELSGMDVHILGPIFLN